MPEPLLLRQSLREDRSVQPQVLMDTLENLLWPSLSFGKALPQGGNRILLWTRLSKDQRKDTVSGHMGPACP